MIYSPLYEICKPLYTSLTQFMKGGKNLILSAFARCNLYSNNLSYNLFLKWMPLRKLLFCCKTSLLNETILKLYWGPVWLLIFESCLLIYSIIFFEEKILSLVIFLTLNNI